MRRFGVLGLFSLIALACGGTSVVDEEESGGAGGTASGGTATGGTATGGTATGGTNDGGATGGTTAGTGVTGGKAGSSSNAGRGGTTGAGTGGTTTAGREPIGGEPGSAGESGSTGESGNSGSAGTGPSDRCLLPLESGSCLAYVPSYGFDAAIGLCVRFAYGGCEGNDNRFATLAECEAACGGSDAGGCPETLPADGEACDGAPPVCHYALNECQCAPSNLECVLFDPTCAPARDALPPAGGAKACSTPDCTSRVVAVGQYLECRCEETFTCTLVDPRQTQ
jgi:hypothetical protein